MHYEEARLATCAALADELLHESSDYEREQIYNFFATHGIDMQVVLEATAAERAAMLV
jgi:hypothetical protein